MRVFFFSFLGLFGPLFLWAQGPYNNEWIDHEKTYFKFKTEETTWHTISYEVLAEAGLSEPTTYWKLFTNGKQIPILIPDDFGPGKAIGFYGIKNDGAADAILFQNPEWQAQPDMSLFSDLRSYYLVDQEEGEHLRYDIVENNLDGALPPAENSFLYTSRRIKANAFASGQPETSSGVAFAYLADFNEGEAWLSGLIKSDLPYTFKIPTPGLKYGVQDKVDVRLNVVGRNRSLGVILDKAAKIEVNGLDRFSHRFSRFSAEEFSFQLKENEIQNEELEMVCRAYDGEVSGWDYETIYSVAWGEVSYPRSFDLQGLSEIAVSLDIDEDTYVEFENLNAVNGIYLLDKELGQLIPASYQDGKHRFFIPKNFELESTKRSFFLFNAFLGNEKINSLEEKTFTNYLLPENQGNFIQISNKILREGAVDQVQRYADFRGSENGGAYRVSDVDVEDLYDQFAFGIDLHPISIKNFVRFAIDQWQSKPEYLFLMGKSVEYSKTRFNSNSAAQCLVPSYGHVASDAFFVSKGMYDYFPELSVGRLPATNANDVRVYLNKVLHYESWKDLDCADLENRAWTKNVLHISKGWGADQTDLFSSFLENFEGTIEGTQTGMNVVDLLTDDYDQPLVGQEETFYPAPDFGEQLENGLALINYFGHGIEDYWQYDISTNPQDYDWQGRYPIFLSNACSVGMIHRPAGEETMVEHYILADSAGTVGFLASTGLNAVSSINTFTSHLLRHLTGDDYRNPFSDAIRHTIQDMYNPSNPAIRKICTEVLWVGDPTIRMYSWDSPEYILDPLSLKLEKDSIDWHANDFQLSFGLKNLGKALEDSVQLGLTFIDETGSIAWETSHPFPAVSYEDTIQMTIPQIPENVRFGGQYDLRFKIDPLEELGETCYENNLAAASLYIAPCMIGCPEEGTGIVQSNKNGAEPMLFPNPSEGSITLDTDGLVVESARILTLEGKLIQLLFEAKQINGRKSFDLSSLPAGSYILEIQGKGFRRSLRFSRS